MWGLGDYIDDLKERIESLKAERDRLAATANLLASSVVWLDRCLGNRGRFSCCEHHDGRCHSMRKNPETCNCGSDGLDKSLNAVYSDKQALEIIKTLEDQIWKT